MYGLEELKPKVGTSLKAVCYKRVSTKEQALKGHSLGVQDQLFQNFVSQNDITIVKEFEDSGKSARDLDRPDMEELLDYCDEHSDSIDLVLVQDSSRLARNVSDHLTIKAFLKKRNIKLIPLDGSYYGDTAEGDFLDVIVAAVNQLESRRTGSKTKRIMKSLAEKGVKPGMAPVGYLNSYQKDIPIYPDPERRHFIRDIFELWLSGNYTVAAITEIEYEKGFRSKEGNKVKKNTITNILKNILYAGGLEYDGLKYVKAIHEGIVPQEWHTYSLAMFEKRNKGANRNRKYTTLLSGYAHCFKCGNQMFGEYHPKGDYYRCHNCSKTYVSLDQADDKVSAFFHGTVFTEDALQELRSVLLEVKKDQGTSVPEQLKSLRLRRDSLDKKMKVIEDKLFAGDALIDTDRIKDRYKPLKDELKHVDDQIRELDKPSTNLKDSEIEKIINGMRRIGDLYDAMEKSQRKQFLRFFISKAFLEKERIITNFELVPEFEALISRDLVRIRSNWLPRVDSNHQPAD
ncbi:MAG: Resolvase domain-containing protein [Candidatus Yanofskybacteria bacterium GW2011_GWD2_39_48]|uniref:Resolvase domain-containing protein n=1 Tax=Candidatus Yanofskybacteria bacterium GW2011_GWD2_39_48 TaxID=1619031 RepID=A0A0G0PF91_9BACT|nr:MAG: Resolvase domain-containing protein [Candidatus Yanofskybacteria bacterium GW2011_GWD2_39_48]